MRKRSPSVRASLLALCGLSVGLAFAIGATAATTRQAATLANSVTYQDSVGENPNALDIGSVIVSNDDAGLVTFDLKFANRSPNPATDFVALLVDADRNRSTGNPNWEGAEWLLTWTGDSSLRQWNGTKWTAAPSMTTLVSIVAPNELTLRVNKSELGNITGFDFGIQAQAWPDPNAEEPTAWDDAPDYGHGLWGYDVKIYVAPVLTASAIKCTPDPPYAGKPMVAQTTVTVMRGTTPELLGANAKITAAATVAGKKLVGTISPSFTSGKVTVKWLVPKTAKGKTMNGKITVTLENVSVTKTFTDRVK